MMRPYVGSWKRLALHGVAAVFFGLTALVWPGITLDALVLLWGAYALVDGITALSAATAFRIYLSEQFPTALRGRGHSFGESTGRVFSGVLAPFLMAPHTGSATIFFGTILVAVTVGAVIPLLFGRETVGQLETVTEGTPAPA